jgi:hypothetical protein
MSATFDFLKADFTGTLFPLKTNLLVAEKHEKEVSEYIYQKILDEKQAADNFLPQQRVYSTKPRGHLRRTVKLDPVVEYFLYDITYRNRAIFRPEVSNARRSFGYRFMGGGHISVHNAYKAYKLCLAESNGKFKHNLQFDIASYFNCLYHHDISIGLPRDRGYLRSIAMRWENASGKSTPGGVLISSRMASTRLK